MFVYIYIFKLHINMHYICEKKCINNVFGIIEGNGYNNDIYFSYLST